MPFSLSPSVIVTENDYTLGVPQVSTSEAGLAGVFRWGPVGIRVLVDVEKTLLTRFGSPSNFNSETWFVGSSFLSYSNIMWVSRAANTSGKSPVVIATVTANSKQVTVGNTALLEQGMIVISSANGNIQVGATVDSIVNSTVFALATTSQALANGVDTVQFVSNYSVYSAIANTGQVVNLIGQTVLNPDDFASKDGSFDLDAPYVARCPGALGNSLRISVCDTANQFTDTINLQSIANGGASFSISVDSNVATVIVTNGHNNTSQNTAQTAAQSNALSLMKEFQVTDYIEFGNSTSGTQSLKVSAFGNVTTNVNSTFAVATFTVNFEDPLRLLQDQVVNTSITRYWEWFNEADKAPGQSNWMTNFGNTAANDELHIVISDEDGLFTGVPGTVLEKYMSVSRATDSKKLDGTTNYYLNLINQGSQYAWATNDRFLGYSNTGVNLSNVLSDTVTVLDFAYGQDGSDEKTISVGDLANAYDLFAAVEEVDMSLIMQGKARGGPNSTQLGNYIIDNIAEIRKDCVAFLSPDYFDVVGTPGFELDNVVEFRGGCRSSSYAFLDSGYKYMYDRYNDLYRWVPLNGDMAGLAARTDQTNDPWWAFAGFNRGKIKNVAKLAWNPEKPDRDILFKNDINPCYSPRNIGPVLFGDKTLLGADSVFSRINVRRLFIEIEKAIATAAQYFIFDFNDAFERAQFRNVVNPYLRTIQGKRGIEDFVFVCDDSNNGPDVRNNFTMVGDVYVIPNKVIDWIQLNFNAVKSGVTFSEIINSPPPTTN
jgi:hypothetical protein